MKGVFTLIDPRTGEEKKLPNLVTTAGSSMLLDALFNNVNITWFIGICGLNVIPSSPGNPQPGEPSNAGGYARQAVTAGSWTIAQVNGVYRAKSSLITFAPVAVNFDQPLVRLFTTFTASSGVGFAISFSAPLATPVTITPSTPYQVNYEFYTN